MRSAPEPARFAPSWRASSASPSSSRRLWQEWPGYSIRWPSCRAARHSRSRRFWVPSARRNISPAPSSCSPGTPNFGGRDHARRLPYLDTVRLEIQRSREIELMRFRRGEVDLISSLNPDQFEQLVGERRTDIRDAGPTLEGEMLWFNMNPSAPIPPYSKTWFASRNFRRAISHAIRRDDLCRMVFHGHAQPGIGPFSAANRFWFNQKLKPHAFDLE